MRRIYKYEVPVNDEAMKVQTHAGAKVVLVGHQGMPRLACIWLEADTDSPIEYRWFRVFGTGHQIPPTYEHVGSYQAPPFVWHIYERVTR